jgi:hypothetical protein
MNRLLKAAAHNPLAHRLIASTSRRRATPQHDGPMPTSLLAHAFSYPEGAGVIGPGAKRLLRTILVDALTHDERVDVIIARPDLDELLGGAPPELPLTVTETLEDAIEHLESRTLQISAAGIVERPPTLWVGTPGPDADVVHHALKHQPGSDLIGLFDGPWPYGPTHFIDMDGPRQLPTQDLKLLSRAQSISRLHAHRAH